MIRKLVLLLILIVSLLLGFFCVKNHTKSILESFIPKQMEKDELQIENISKIENKIEIKKIIPQPSVQVIESVERIEPVVIIRVDESQPNRPNIKKMNTQDLFDNKNPLDIKKPIETKPIVKPPLLIAIPEIEPTPVSRDFNKIERQMLKEMNKEFKIPTPTPVKDISKVINKSMEIKNKAEKESDNELAELEKQMLEEMKNFK